MADIVTLDQAAKYCRITADVETADGQLLQWCVSAATPLIEAIVGPCTQQTYTEYYSGGAATIVPVHQPVTAVLSVTEYIGPVGYALTDEPLGSQTTPWGYTVDPVTATIQRRTMSGAAFPFAPGESNIEVTYTAGPTSVPANVTLAALRLIKHLYDSTLPKSPKVSKDMMDSGVPDVEGFAVPPFVAELLEPSWVGPGIA